jgi:hypothetical protein
MVSTSEDHSTLSLKCAVEEPSDSMEETLYYQENPRMHPCNSSLIKRLIQSRVGNTKTDLLISNHQVDQPTCKSGILTLSGGKSSKLKERTSSTQEERSLMLLEESTMKIKTSSLLQETTK